MNDNPPVFTKSTVEVSFPENNAPGERCRHSSGLRCRQRQKMQKSPTPWDSSVNGIFPLMQDTGDIRVNTILDREQTERYEFKIIAKDKGMPVLQGSATVVVLVADKNDNEPKFMQDVFTF